MLSEFLTFTVPLELDDPKVPTAVLVLALPEEPSCPAVFVPLDDATPEDVLQDHCMSKLQPWQSECRLCSLLHQSLLQATPTELSKLLASAKRRPLKPAASVQP